VIYKSIFFSSIKRLGAVILLISVVAFSYSFTDAEEPIGLFDKAPLNPAFIN
jgi:hypothetical protein